MKHEAKVLTKEEVESKRSSAYEYLELETNQSRICDCIKDVGQCYCKIGNND